MSHGDLHVAHLQEGLDGSQHPATLFSVKTFDNLKKEEKKMSHTL